MDINGVKTTEMFSEPGLSEVFSADVLVGFCWWCFGVGVFLLLLFSAAGALGAGGDFCSRHFGSGVWVVSGGVFGMMFVVVVVFCIIPSSSLCWQPFVSPLF